MVTGENTVLDTVDGDTLTKDVPASQTKRELSKASEVNADRLHERFCMCDSLLPKEFKKQEPGKALILLCFLGMLW